MRRRIRLLRLVMPAPRPEPSPTLPLVDLHPEPDDIRADVVAGLSATPKSLPCKYFYDDVGSALFEQICDLPEYYPTRTELAILADHLPDMVRRLGPGTRVVEFGSGSGRKTELLLAALTEPATYVPVEIARGPLLASAAQLAERFPRIAVRPVCADFTQPLSLPEPARSMGRTVIFFPGSTIGNFTPDEAVHLMQNAGELAGDGGAMLIGTDLQKDPRVLEAAYNDAAGVTAAFNLNLLRRINRELQSDFDLAAFEHTAPYNHELGRIEMFLQSTREQVVTVDQHSFEFAAGERIHTESSHKYTMDGFERMATVAGWSVVDRWTDPREWFAEWLLVKNPD